MSDKASATAIDAPGVDSPSKKPQIVAELQSLLGEKVVLLPVPFETKNPGAKGWTGWQKTTITEMRDPAYLAKFNGAVNIGVLLGKPSDNLCSVDVDSDADMEEFLRLNPKLQDTLRTRGARGGNIFVRIRGDFPKLHSLKWKPGPGEDKGKKWGEWRADGGQTIIHGRHPSGCDYQITNRAEPLEITFAEINWKVGLPLPWESDHADNLVKLYGEPFFLSDEGALAGVNERFWGATVLQETRLLHEPNEREFYRYDAECGLWKPVTAEAMTEHVSQRLFRYRAESGRVDVERLIRQARIKPIVETLRGMAERRDAFINKPCLIHFANGVVRFTPDGDVQFGGFSPEDYSRNQSPSVFDENAECPRFLSELILPAVSPEDADLLQRWAGVALYGYNLPQRILILDGMPGGGKSTLATIIGMLIGRENVYQLRTECLAERFETYRYRRKTLLLGADVPGDFLTHRGAPVLKALVGGDLLSAEGKGSNADFAIRGIFNVLITCNSRLRVRLEGDTGAWRRRLLIVRYQNPPPGRKIQNFADILVRDEGAGIARWALQGFVRAMAEFDETGDFALTDGQRARVDGLLAESDSVENFLHLCVCKNDCGDLTSEEVTERYARFCADQGWEAAPITVVERQLTDLMLRMFQTAKSNCVLRDKKSKRGWKGVAFKP